MRYDTSKTVHRIPLVGWLHDAFCVLAIACYLKEAYIRYVRRLIKW